jgi:hypothetical protein
MSSAVPSNKDRMPAQPMIRLLKLIAKHGNAGALMITAKATTSLDPASLS